MTISDFFDTTHNSAPTHNWVLNTHKAEDGSIDDLAFILATEIVRHFCRRCTHHFDAWKNKVEEGTPLKESAQKALYAFLVPTFGEPNNYFDSARSDHLEGFIGEWLWYFLSLSIPVEPIIHIIPPGFKSTDPGGDALIIHRTDNNEMLFRLWEMKKFAPRIDDSSQQINSTVRRAYVQLNTKATEYLARLTTTEQVLDDPELEDFFSKLLDLWIEASRQASAGVSVVTSSKFVSQNCFNEFGEQFPDFIDPIRLLGMLTSIEDYSEFTIKVQEFIWKGL